MQIPKELISIQEKCEFSDLLELDYPPKIEVGIQKIPTSQDSEPLRIHIEGLDRESTTSFLPGTLISHSLF